MISDEQLKNVDNEHLQKVIDDFEKVGLSVALRQGFSLDYYYMAKELIQARQTIADLKADGERLADIARAYEAAIYDDDEEVYEIVIINQLAEHAALYKRLEGK